MSTQQQNVSSYFEGKSNEQIIEWMLTNLDPNQIRSCLVVDDTSLLPLSDPRKADQVPSADDLRKWCINKPYVIEKVEDGKVSFWYFEDGEWTYWTKELENFPKTEGGKAQECDPSDELDGQELTNFEAKKIKKFPFYKNIDQIKQAIQCQRETQDKNQKVIKFAPVLIESVYNENVNYYYIDFEKNEFIVKGENDVVKTPLKECQDEFTRLYENLLNKLKEEDLDIQAGIKTAVTKFFDRNQDFQADLKTIKSVYSVFPLSIDSTYFMKNLFDDQNNFGKVNNFNNINDYIENLYGKKFVELFKFEIKENKFGYKTLFYNLK